MTDAEKILRHGVFDVESKQMVAAFMTAGAAVRYADAYEQWYKRTADVRKIR